MNIQKIKVEEITAEIIERQTDEWKLAVEESKAASAAYMEDLEARKAALMKRAGEYQTQLNLLTEERKSLAEKVTDLSSRGEIDEAADVDAKVEEMDRTISSLQHKLRLVNASGLKGDPGCYVTAKQTQTVTEEERDKCVEALNQLYQKVQAEVCRLRELLTKIGHLSSYVRKYGCDDNFNFVDRHYREIDRIEREAREQCQAEQESKSDADRKAKIQVVVPL